MVVNRLLRAKNRLALLKERNKDNSKIIAKLKRQIRNMESERSL